MITLVVGHLKEIVVYAAKQGLRKEDFVAVYVRRAERALVGRRPEETEIVYVDGADWVLAQPGVRGYVGMLVAHGAKERVA